MIILLFIIILALILYVAYLQYLWYVERKGILSRINTEVPIKPINSEKKANIVINPIKKRKMELEKQRFNNK